MQIVSTDTPAKGAGEHINTLIEGHAGDVLCLLSGGSALDVIEHLRQPTTTKGRGDIAGNEPIELRTILFMMGDERGSRESSANNYLQLAERYPDHWVTTSCLETVPNEAESLPGFATRISDQLDQALAQLRDPLVIHLMGMGGDGHTAGIFPLTVDEFARTYERDPSIVEVRLEGLTIDSRASVTPGWIMDHVDQVVSYAAGESKSAILESLKTETKTIQERPAELWKLKSGTMVYTNQVVSP